MSVNFATLQGLSIPEGKVVEIKDALGRVIWAVSGGKVVLEVEKITSNTYAAETTYQNEQFILLDIYPKTNGTVNVTYGGLTKTITDTSGAESPNSQQVFFGTFNGASDGATTPASGELTIEGDYASWGNGQYQKSSKGTDLGYGCDITSVVDWGSLEHIGMSAFRGCKNLTQMSIPDGIKSIGNNAFHGCTTLTSVTIPDSVISIGTYAFYNCTSLTSISSLQCATIGDYAFGACIALTSIPLAEGVVSIGESAFSLGSAADMKSLSPMYNGAITIPSTVQSIGMFAFSTTNDSPNTAQANINQHYLTEVYILPTTPPLEDGMYLENVFGDANSSCKMVVPKGCLKVYQALSGGDFWDSYIVEAS